MSQQPQQAAHLRWFGAARLIGVVRGEPGITRAAAVARLGIGSGGATELVARMRRVRLLDEGPAPVVGRGRPTTLLRPHPQGPLVVAAELRAHDWRLAVAGIDGTPRIVASARYSGGDIDAALAEITAAIGALYRTDAGRIRAAAVSVAGTITGTTIGQFTSRGWSDVDLSVLTADIPAGAGVRLVLGNDATLAGLAEARTGASRHAGTALHLIVAVGIGGALIVNGEPLTGAQGAAGEYGHVPFADPALVCPCGARGCWDLTIDGRALARHRGDPPPGDPVDYAHRLIAMPTRDVRTREAFAAVAGALGRGIAGLVNVHDPDVVTLGGLAAALRAAAPDAFGAAYRGGLMAFRKASPPPVHDGAHGEEATILGAVTLALDQVTTAGALAEWVDSLDDRAADSTVDR
jgi:predicted NBD/HSP70 family sugar kinase